MEVVKKTVSLEPYVSRVYGGLPFIGYDPSTPPKSNWGKVIKTVDFTKFTDEDISKYGNNIRMWGKMTYPTLMETYYALKNRETSSLSEIETTVANKVEEEKNRSLIRFVEMNKLVVGNEIKGVKCGCPMPKKEKKEYSIPIIGGGDTDERFLVPEININVLMTQTANLIGSFTILPKDWVAGKKYYIGDPVVYDSQVYVLNSTPFENVDECVDLLTDETVFSETKNLFIRGAEVSYYVLDSIQDLMGFDDGYSIQGKNTSIDNFVDVKTVDEIITNGYTFAKCNEKYYIKPYFTGYLDQNTFQLYFDEVDGDGNFVGVGSDGSTTHWRLRSTSFENSEIANVTVRDDGGVTHLNGEGVDISHGSTAVEEVINESRLNEFVRLSKTIDDNREELPGKKIDNSGALALPYTIGAIKNIQSTLGDSGEKFYTGDYLESVLVNNHVLVSDEDFTQYIAGFNEGDEGSIEFIYYIGCNLNLSSDEVFTPENDYTLNAMKYVDKYSFEIKTIDTILNEEEETFKYMSIDYESGSEFVLLENLDNVQYLAKLSKVNYKTTDVIDGAFNKSPDFISAPFFMEDYKLGLTYLKSNYDDFVIDRGNAAAFERHLRLSEVKTVQDIENYGNGFFEMKK